MDILIKLLSVFSPAILYLFSKAYRMAHQRTYYQGQLAALKEYVTHYYEKAVLFSLKDMAAKVVTCNTIIGSQLLDFFLKNDTKNLYTTLNDYLHARKMIKPVEQADKSIILTCQFKEDDLKILIKLILGYYVLSCILFLSKNFFVQVMQSIGIKPFQVSTSLLDFWMNVFSINFLISLILLFTVLRWITHVLKLSHCSGTI
jgi:hypothetical protein